MSATLCLSAATTHWMFTYTFACLSTPLSLMRTCTAAAAGACVCGQDQRISKIYRKWFLCQIVSDHTMCADMTALSSVYYTTYKHIHTYTLTIHALHVYVPIIRFLSFSWKFNCFQFKNINVFRTRLFIIPIYILSEQAMSQFVCTAHATSFSDANDVNVLYRRRKISCFFLNSLCCFCRTHTVWKQKFQFISIVSVCQHAIAHTLYVYNIIVFKAIKRCAFFYNGIYLTFC